MIGFELQKFCRAYMREFPDLPIRYGQFAVLEILCNGVRGMTPMQIADMLHVSRPMIAAHLGVLQADGFVVRVASPDDGRSVYILPTKQAQKLVDKTKQDLEKIHAVLIQKMGQKKFETFVRLAYMANDFLSDQL